MLNKRSSRGFTLIEVLVAGAILFAVVSMISLSLRAALTSSQKAAERVQLLSVVPMLVNTIKYRLQHDQKQEVQSQTGVLDGFRFSWTATLIKRGAPPARFSIDDDRVLRFEEKFFLWDISLVISKGEYEKSLNYQELTWKSR